MNSVHVLTRDLLEWQDLFYACKQSCDIIIPVVDTLIAGGIRKDESAFLLSPKDILNICLQIFIQFLLTCSCKRWIVRKF